MSKINVVNLSHPSASSPNIVLNSDGTITTSVVTLNATSVIDSLGNVRDIPVNTRSVAYTLVATDSGKCINVTGGSGVTVPPNVFSSGNTIAIYNNTSGSISLTQGSGVTLTLAGYNLTGNRTIPQSGFCSIICISSNSFIVLGAGLT